MSTASKPVSRGRSPQRPPLYPVPTRAGMPMKANPGQRRRTPAVANLGVSANPAVSPVGVGKVRRLPSPRKLPLWLRFMLLAQRSSLVAAFLLVMGALLVYGNTVYTQQLWSKNFRDLRTFQRSDRQLTAAVGMLQNQVAQQAERPDSGMVLQKPSSMIFVEPASQRQLPEVAPTVPAPTTKTPLGY